MGNSERIGDVRVVGDGSWCWFADPRALRHDGRRRQTYVGWLDPQGTVRVAAFDHDTGERFTAVLQPRLGIDDHGSPSLFVEPDGRITACFSAHHGRRMFLRTTLEPEDI